MDKTATVLFLMYSGLGLSALGTLAMFITVIIEKRQKRQREEAKMS